MEFKNTTTEVFGKRLKELRKANGYTIEQFAEIVGIAKSTLGYYENEKRMPDVEVLSRICDALNVPADYLLGRTNTIAMKGKMKTVCEMTGLSDSTVEYLAQLVKERDHAKLDIINHLFDEAHDDYDYYYYQQNGGAECASSVLNALYLYFGSLLERGYNEWDDLEGLSDERREVLETAYKQYLFSLVVDAVKESGMAYRAYNTERD